MTRISAWHLCIAAAIATAAIAEACEHQHPSTLPPPPLGQSTAPVSLAPDNPHPDSAGVPQPSAPTPPVNPPTGMTDVRGDVRMAQVEPRPIDAAPPPPVDAPKPYGTETSNSEGTMSPTFIDPGYSDAGARSTQGAH
ncbi:MAG TPA: hypothetical protein VMJ10_13595 [Kofleriaceae bacterium]|nr:hypothetical protein [Kofleriaceae bacterium]